MQLSPVIPVSNIVFPICSKCNGPIMFFCGIPECCCGIPEEEFYIPTSCNPPYINHCWNCGTTIDSRICIRSVNPTMGFHCNECGEDLTNWKIKSR